MDIAKYWNTIFETLSDGLMIVDPEGRIIAINPAGEKLTGYSKGELVGNSCRILNCTGCKIHGDTSEVGWCGLYSEGLIRAKECQISHKDRHTVHIQKNASVLKDENGSVIGAVETLTDISEVVRQKNEIQNLRRECRLDTDFHGIIGRSRAIGNVCELIENVALTESPVMIHGESGTGKELVARAIHESGNRKGKPFIKVNCAALNENLLESELFGHVRGAFTGAIQTRIGRFEAAQDGTLFLDEIGDIPMPTQVKLLRVLEEKVIERVGDHTPIPVNVRIITASNKNLDDLIHRELFREDLYFRINVFPLRVPPLQERLDDIPMIAQAFIERNNAQRGRIIIGLEPEAMKKLLAYSWPGNVRELRNAIEYAFVLCHADEISVDHLPPRIISGNSIHRPANGSAKHETKGRGSMLAALKKARGNQTKAAEILGVSRVTVWKRMKKFNIDPNVDI